MHGPVYNHTKLISWEELRVENRLTNMPFEAQLLNNGTFHGTPDIISLYTKCASAQWLKNTAGDTAVLLPLSICPLV